MFQAKDTKQAIGNAIFYGTIVGVSVFVYTLCAYSDGLAVGKDSALESDGLPADDDGADSATDSPEPLESGE